MMESWNTGKAGSLREETSGQSLDREGDSGRGRPLFFRA
jgi:hypothetical protein